MSEESVPNDAHFKADSSASTSAPAALPWIPLLASAFVFLSLLGLILYFVYTKWLRKESSVASPRKKIVGKINDAHAVGLEDIVYLTHVLHPTASTPLDVLYAALSTPDMVATTQVEVDRIQALRQERMAHEKRHTQQHMVDFDDLLQEGEWDEDDDDDDDDSDNNALKEARRKAQQAEREKQDELARLKQATGQATQLLEGIDPGVLGQTWVEQTLQKKQVWPTSVPSLLNETTWTVPSGSKHQSTSALDHPAVRRNICMVMARLHSHYLNTHTELLEAGVQKKIDQTYFKSSMEFRGRMAVMLEACIKISIMMRSFRLLTTVIDAYVAYKIGCLPESVAFFNGLMGKQYGTLPRLALSDATILTDQGPLQISFSLERLHAQAFLKTKLELCQKQGIPPQVALQTFQEIWWVLMRWERVDGGTNAVDPLDRKDGDLMPHIPESDITKFEKDDANYRLRHAFPILVKNVGEKQAQIKIPFPAPQLPGQYRFTISIKSQDYLGADQTVSLEATITDAMIQASAQAPAPGTLRSDNDDDATEVEAKKEK
jgi:hypothetical protein